MSAAGDSSPVRQGPVAVRFSDVDFSYGPVPVLSSVSFHVHESEFVALVGPNGAGKTTVLKLLLGLERPRSGTIELFGRPQRAGLPLIGYVPQHASYDPAFPVQVREVVRMGRIRPFGFRRSREDELCVQEALERVEIADLADRSYSALSGGQRRRVLVARALASRPKMLILDEPTANMDSESEERLFATLGALKGNTTVLIVTHDSGFVSSLTDVVLCVGDRSSAEKGRTVVRHRTEPVAGLPPELYGGNAVRVRHDENLPDSWCCKGDHS